MSTNTPASANGNESHASGGQGSEWGLAGSEPPVSVGLGSFWRRRAEKVFLPLQLLEAACLPWLVAPHCLALCSHVSISPTLTLLPPPGEDPRGCQARWQGSELPVPTGAASALATAVSPEPAKGAQMNVFY